MLYLIKLLFVYKLYSKYAVLEMKFELTGLNQILEFISI